VRRGAEADDRRRTACGVPENTAFATKPMLGWTMIQAVHQAGRLRCRWVACDEAFGRDTTLLDNIAGLQLWYDAEVPHDTRVWQERPATSVPAWPGRGRKPTRAQVVSSAAAPQSVALIGSAMADSARSQQVIKEGSKGPIVADFATLRVLAVRDGLPGPEGWLILRRHGLTGELKTYLSNAPVDIPQVTLVWMSGMRWPIETCFEDGKQLLGMGDADRSTHSVEMKSRCSTSAVQRILRFRVSMSSGRSREGPLVFPHEAGCCVPLILKLRRDAPLQSVLMATAPARKALITTRSARP
jgi:SRSO17 transposase